MAPGVFGCAERRCVDPDDKCTYTLPLVVHTHSFQSYIRDPDDKCTYTLPLVVHTHSFQSYIRTPFSRQDIPCADGRISLRSLLFVMSFMVSWSGN